MRNAVRAFAAAALLALCACGNEASENLIVKAEALEIAANAAEDPVQAEVLRNEARALREAAEGREKVDAEGSVTVIED